MHEVFAGANYELYTVELVVDAKHKTVGGRGSVELSGSGQTFDFEGAESWDGSRRIHATAEGWREFQPKLVWTKPSSVGM